MVSLFNQRLCLSAAIDTLAEPLLLCFGCQHFPLARFRYIEGEAHGQKSADAGAAINMHLAALLALRQTGAAGQAALSATGSRYSSTLAGSSSDSTQSPRLGSKENAVSGDNAASMRLKKQALAGVVDGAARASVVAIERSNAPMVDLVAGVLDAEEVRVREAGMAGIVKTKANNKTT